LVSDELPLGPAPLGRTMGFLDALHHSAVDNG
jgi:hypothetical protein